jgi:CheY-like chemotaxis protein
MARILIVDDDDGVRRVLRKMFERSGHDVMEAATGDAALATLIGPGGPDAVVSDVLMPGISGIAFYKKLAERAPHLRGRVVFLTGANQDPDVHRPIEQLGVPMLGKLDDLQLVVDAIRIALLRRTTG